MPILLPLMLAAAPPASDVAGIWDFKAGDQIIFRLDIEDTPSGMTAVWERPESFEFDGDDFSDVKGPATRRPAHSVRLVNGDIELSFDDPTPGATPDNFRLHRLDADHVTLSYEGVPIEPFTLVRSPANAPALGPWDSDRTYNRTVARPTNAEMTAIFNADQADRQSDAIDWSIVEPADRKRRARTEALLDSGALQSGEDFYHAAFVFQHGSTPDDFLKAHLLAMIAIARGKSGAIWIASATLDRYLQTIGKPQVLGTQYMLPEKSPVTQEPYDRTLVSDAMRKALHVPTIAEQQEQVRQYQQQKDAAAAKPAR